MDKQWFETWFDSPYYHLLYKNRDTREAAGFLDQLLSILQPAPKGRILDLACGKGRHSIYLNAKGYTVEGADISANNIKAAKVNENESLHFFEHDMREALEAQRYDYVFNLFTSFGYFETDEEHLQTLQNIYNSLISGGVFVLDYLNVQKVKANIKKEEHLILDNIEFRINRELSGGYISKTICFDCKGESYKFTERVRAFTQSEIQEMLERVGFKIKSIFGDYSLNDFDVETSNRLISIAEK